MLNTLHKEALTIEFKRNTAIQKFLFR